MIKQVVEAIFPVVDSLILIYSTALIISYILMGLLASYALYKYLSRNRSTNLNTILFADSMEPGVSVIASSYNESAVIVDCVHSLLMLQYNNYEVIIVNDGSTDDSLDKMCKEFDLVKMDYYVNEQLKSEQVRGIYRSTNKAYHHLVYVDKINGGKADAMNAGLNISTKLYAVCIDVDSVLAPDALLKLVKPIVEATDKPVVAVGAAVHVANGCEFSNGVLVDRRIPSGYSARLQVVEYFRAFLIGRMAFGQINGLMLISGALGIFRKDLVINAGGYLSRSIGEDIEMTVRLRKYLYEHKLPHKIAYIPEPLLWTEIPQTVKVMDRQRTRWTRGLMDMLCLHRNLFFNPKYGVLGMVSYPYFLFFEWFAPFVEALGMIYVVLLALLGMIQWQSYLFLFVFMYLFGVAFSFLSIFFSELTFHVYERKRDVWRLFFVSLTEIFLYHPRIVLWAIKGNWMFLRGQKGWGNMPRQGFKQATSK